MARHDYHVAVIPFPLASHPGVLLNVIKHLASLLTGGSYESGDMHFTIFGTPKSNSGLSIAGYEDNIKLYDISYDGGPVSFMTDAPREAVRNAMFQAESETGKKFTCVIVDPFMGFVADIAEEMNVPFVASWSSALQPLQTHVYTDVIREKIGVDGNHKEDELLSFVPGLSNLRVQDLPYRVISGNLQSPEAEMLNKMGKILPRATAIIVNTFEELDDLELINDLKSNLNPNILCTGHFNLVTPSPKSNDPHQCLAWLDHQPTRSIVYIAFGTFNCPSPSELTAIAAAIEDTGVGFLWVLKPEQVSSSLATSFLDKVTDSRINGMFVPWAPQMAVLEHPAVGAHMTHFGWNSVMESMFTGVPMIGRPFMADHPVSARMVTTLGIGVVEDDTGVLTKAGVGRSLEKVLKEGKYREQIIKDAAKLKDLIKGAVVPEGTSNNNYKKLVRILADSTKS